MDKQLDQASRVGSTRPRRPTKATIRIPRESLAETVAYHRAQLTKQGLVAS